ncbi:glycine betaine ABC transporter substrate-binding protein [Rhodococcus sp. IEGM 1408]|uniref:glycine betaine ABC transporter substrate-binding protein n=1 Tax=Rhodococcus sp. IEGM 1408 TaxID=3082220 RepID=UPI0029559486|nr:glycine betaine ABC transporter substrate-binding protein [Rhodococcus sp. IEGM 1408]MDV7999753.1 glycine betaine ABC transporter substrate-binding protein [Rhodococcus sp. IEGM 1408]
MKRTRTRAGRLLATCLATFLATLLVATGCGLNNGGSVPLGVGPGPSGTVPALEGVAVTVGGKDFTEGVISSYLVEFLLAAAGMEVSDMSSLAGSNSFRQALISGQVDIGMEYTGTAWMSYLGNEEPIRDPEAQWEAVRDADLEAHDIRWMRPTTVDNTYSFALNRATAEETGVSTFSDYARLVQTDPQSAVTCMETEFAVRRDGWPGLADAYGFDADAVPVSIMQPGIIYQATSTGRECRFGEVYVTDGRVKGLDLVVLKDDKRFFPVYNLATVVRGAYLDAHPELEEVLSPLVEVLTNDVMVELNMRVDVDGEDPALVARDFLVEQGLVSAG